jgi:hypothetical protein
MPPEALKVGSSDWKYGREGVVKFNEMLDKLTVHRFFEFYEELRDYYEYLAKKYHFDLNTHTVDPDVGEIVPIIDKE